MKHSFSLSLSLSLSLVQSDYKYNGFVSGGRNIKGDGASTPLYQGPLA
ncbi:hypothetical protein CFP56_007180 [Quercus suber]|uniref:Uncharacterized protein n=1 Tax=Quercus suber TaxID=58331 RepID=A0AAW0J962_QUESU